MGEVFDLDELLTKYPDCHVEVGTATKCKDVVSLFQYPHIANLGTETADNILNISRNAAAEFRTPLNEILSNVDRELSTVKDFDGVFELTITKAGVLLGRAEGYESNN